MASTSSGHDPRSWPSLVAFVVLIAIGLSVGTLLNSNHIGAIEQRDTQKLHGDDAMQRGELSQARQAEYRICLRQMAVRAAILIDEPRGPAPLVLYDCTPNLVGLAAVPYTAAQRRAFLRDEERGQLP